MTNKNEYSARVRKLNKQLLGEAYFGEASGYDEFFRSALDKFGVSSPDELGDKKDEFFDYVDKNWDAGENETDVDEGCDKDVDEAIVDPEQKPKPKLVDPSQQDIEKVDEASDVDDAIDSPGVEDFEKNVHDEPDPESDLEVEAALREMIRQEIASLSESKKKRLSEAKIKVGDQFNADGITWKVIQVGQTQSKATKITKGGPKVQTKVYDNKIIEKQL